MLELAVVYRGRGWRWPLRAGDAVEIYEEGHSGHIATLDGGVVAAILETWLAMTALTRAIDAAAPVLPRRPLASLPPAAPLAYPDVRQRLSAQRRTRARG